MVAFYLILFPAILSSLLGLTSQDQQRIHHQLQEANLKLAQLGNKQTNNPFFPILCEFTIQIQTCNSKDIEMDLDVDVDVDFPSIAWNPQIN